jgi:hypothetical protein
VGKADANAVAGALVGALADARSLLWLSSCWPQAKTTSDEASRKA